MTEKKKTSLFIRPLTPKKGDLPNDYANLFIRVGETRKKAYTYAEKIISLELAKETEPVEYQTFVSQIKEKVDEKFPLEMQLSDIEILVLDCKNIEFIKTTYVKLKKN